MDIEMTLCECGCGQSVRPGKRSISGHNSKFQNGMLGHHHTPETKLKISQNKERALSISLAKIGVPRSEETREKLRTCRPGFRHSEYSKLKMSVSRAGLKRKPCSEATKAKIGAKARGRVASLETRQKISAAQLGKSRNTGRVWTDEERMKASLSHKGVNKGPKNGNWQGGCDNLPYSSDFNKPLRDKIKARDNYMCQICSASKNVKRLEIHHIDYSRTNSNPTNLISLCTVCHKKTNHNRMVWIDYFNALFNLNDEGDKHGKLDS